MNLAIVLQAAATVAQSLDGMSLYDPKAGEIRGLTDGEKAAALSAVAHVLSRG